MRLALQDHVRFATALTEKPLAAAIDSPVGGIPRGALTEIAGPMSSGRTSLLTSLLAKVSSAQEFCALIDVGDCFDPASAEAAGVRLSQLLWVRCGGNVEHALKAADWLAQAGGFGLVAVDLGETSPEATRRIPLAVWFRLRQAVENTRTVLVALAGRSHASSCSALKVQFQPAHAVWQGHPSERVLHGATVLAEYSRNHHSQPVSFTCSS